MKIMNTIKTTETVNCLKIFCFSALLLFFSADTFCGTPKESKKRQEKIRKMVESYVKSGQNLHSPKVKKDFYKELAKFLPLEPDLKPDLRAPGQMHQEAAKLVKEKFPEDIRELRCKAKAQAKKKYKVCKPLDYATVHYQRGEKTYTIRGVFYGYGGNSIRIASSIIAIYDLMPDSRYKFDKEYCLNMREKYVSDKITDYQRKKINFSTYINHKLKMDQIKHNEDAGYIYMLGNWKNAKEVAQIYIKALAGEPENKTREKIAEKKPSPSSPAEPEPEVTAKKKKPENDIKYEKLIKELERRRMEIANTCAGIDADQGYKSNTVMWGMTAEDVKLLLEKSQEKVSSYSVNPKNPDEKIMKVVTQQGPLEEVSLYFLNDTFYKVVIDFKILSNLAMRRLGNIFNERYGLTDEQKAERKKLEEEDKEFDEAEKAAEAKKNDKEPKKLPVEQVFHWTGKITHGYVEIKLTEDRKAYKEFKLIKENPKVKIEAEALAIKEKQRKAEKKRWKEMEEFKKQKITF